MIVNHPISQLLNPPRFLQYGDLTCVIKLMLRDPVEHEVKIIFFARNPFAQSGLRQSSNRFDQYIVRALRVRHGLAPRGFSRFGNDGKISNSCGLSFLASKAATTSCVPDSDVQNKFPDAVGIGQWFGRGCGCIHILQQLKQRWTMPGVALECTAKLLRDEGGFRTWRGHDL